MADGVENPKAYTPRSSGSRSFMPSKEFTTCDRCDVTSMSRRSCAQRQTKCADASAGIPHSQQGERPWSAVAPCTADGAACEAPRHRSSCWFACPLDMSDGTSEAVDLTWRQPHLDALGGLEGHALLCIELPWRGRRPVTHVRGCSGGCAADQLTIASCQLPRLGAPCCVFSSTIRQPVACCGNSCVHFYTTWVDDCMCPATSLLFADHHSHAIRNIAASVCSIACLRQRQKVLAGYQFEMSR